MSDSTVKTVMRWFAVLLVMGLLAGCVKQGRPIVTERAQPPDARIATYMVRKGDTLYSIAWRFNLDVKDVARRNGLRAPYTIYPGQQLRLRGPAVRNTVARKPAPKASPKPKSTVKKPSPKSAPAKKKRSSAPAHFRWPVAAEPVREYGKGNKGLDFQLRSGVRVIATAAGRVVYAGSGLGGYATLVIVRHTGGYLSAYSLNQDVAVKEGQEIKVGAKIADIVGAGRAAKLHFEIRKDGEPISPRSVMR